MADEQTISHLVIDEAQRVIDFVSVGDCGVSRIVHETDGNREWFAVYVEDHVSKRINGMYVVEIGYLTPEED